MYLAPIAKVSGTLHGYPDGDRGNRVTLGLMRGMVRKFRTSPRVRAAALSVIYTTPERDYMGEIGRLFAFVRDEIRYTRDVHGVETLATPIKTLEIGAGDCDDKATLLAALIESIGHPTRFVMTGYRGSPVFQHVYLQAFTRGQWISLDPTEPYCAGWSAPDASSIFIERV